MPLPSFTSRSTFGQRLALGIGLIILVFIMIIAIARGLRQSRTWQATTASAPSPMMPSGIAGSMPPIFDTAEKGMMANIGVAQDAVARPEAVRESGMMNLAQRVIKTAELELRVTDTSKAVNDARAIATQRGGFTETSSMYDQGIGPRIASLTIRIPVTGFEESLAAFKAIGVQTLRESLHGQDVTEEFIDIEADLRNARAEESSYLEILKRSGSIEDTLAVTQRLSDVRGRIERLEGRKRYLENRTDLATISLTLTEEARVSLPSSTWNPGETWRAALRDLVESIQRLATAGIRSGVFILGLFVPLIGGAVLVLWLIWKGASAIARRVK